MNLTAFTILALIWLVLTFPLALIIGRRLGEIGREMDDDDRG